jgi:hypothetical protein
MKTENRRKLMAGLSGGALLVLAGCKSEPKPDATATLLNNEEVHSAVTALFGSLSDLESDLARFDDESWRDVVPDVKNAAIGVSNAAVQLRTALGYPEVS